MCRILIYTLADPNSRPTELSPDRARMLGQERPLNEIFQGVLEWANPDPPTPISPTAIPILWTPNQSITVEYRPESGRATFARKQLLEDWLQLRGWGEFGVSINGPGVLRVRAQQDLGKKTPPYATFQAFQAMGIALWEAGCSWIPNYTDLVPALTLPSPTLPQLGAALWPLLLQTQDYGRLAWVSNGDLVTAGIVDRERWVAAQSAWEPPISSTGPWLGRPHPGYLLGGGSAWYEIMASTDPTVDWCACCLPDDALAESDQGVADLRWEVLIRLDRALREGPVFLDADAEYAEYGSWD